MSSDVKITGWDDFSIHIIDENGVRKSADDMTFGDFRKMLSYETVGKLIKRLGQFSPDTKVKLIFDGVVVDQEICFNKIYVDKVNPKNGEQFALISNGASAEMLKVLEECENFLGMIDGR